MVLNVITLFHQAFELAMGCLHFNFAPATVSTLRVVSIRLFIPQLITAVSSYPPALQPSFYRFKRVKTAYRFGAIRFASLSA